jgi:glycosyltransferase involved in cell wall biosynthesis
VIATLHNYRLACPQATMRRDGEFCDLCVGSSARPALQHRCVNGSLVQSVAGVATRSSWSRSFGSIDRFLAPSAVVAEVAIAAGVPSSKVRILPHFTTDPGPRSSAPSASPTVLFVGRLSEEKGVDVLLEAWAQRERSEQLVICGDGPLRSRLEVCAPSSVTFRGAVTPSEAAREMLSARVIVVPSIWQEPFGLVTIEAMAAGLGVITTDHPSHREIVGEQAGRFAQPGDTPSLGAVLDELDDTSVDRMGRAGRLEFERRFRPDVHLSALEALYREVLR